ncbi:hypothetical protein A0H81_11499 [Grifola frondosa]|uniref:histidine kinase n=1 Tax=Grifola frondosa TaxID=5627 RepID=A0A1C7LV98_GRIFR|nr:hypothetical protein A0H81_11499 [Grifola frondosa]
MRIKAQARERPAPEFGWQYWVRAHYETISVFLTVRAAIWGIAIAFTHYCGMWAMEIPEGRITWDMRLITLSYLVAFAVCFVGCIAMVHMEAHFGRQVAFSTIAATGCCSMHYIGMAAATFHSYAPPSPQARYPPYLPVTIICVAVFVCVVSNGMLAHSAIIARNRMAEMIITKRRLWRIMAEKEAAEQAIELKQQFISVASHEIRTPLHTVNGYCELLVRTHLTEEQSLYVTSIQQACHAINVIAGNVLGPHERKFWHRYLRIYPSANITFCLLAPLQCPKVLRARLHLRRRLYGCGRPAHDQSERHGLRDPTELPRRALRAVPAGGHLTHAAAPGHGARPEHRKAPRAAHVRHR